MEEPSLIMIVALDCRHWQVGETVTLIGAIVPCKKCPDKRRGRIVASMLARREVTQL